jgi:hypothetical protein
MPTINNRYMRIAASLDSDGDGIVAGPKADLGTALGWDTRVALDRVGKRDGVLTTKELAADLALANPRDVDALEQAVAMVRPNDNVSVTRMQLAWVNFAQALAPKLPTIRPELSVRPARNFFQRIYDWLLNLGGRLIGDIELVDDCFYGVTSYRAQVSPGLWRGARVDSVKEMIALRDVITANGGRKPVIIDLRAEGKGDADYATAAGLREYRIRLADNVPVAMSDVKTFLELAHRPENQPVYVHCEAGKGRTGIMCAAYRMAVQGWSAEEAIAEAKEYGMGIPDQYNCIYDIADAIARGELPHYF